MKPLSAYKRRIPERIYAVLERRGFTELMPTQWKAIEAGLFEDRNLLVCTPTASGKTLVAELAALNAIFHDQGKVVYITPLRALATEKFRAVQKHYQEIRCAVTTGDVDSDDAWLARYDMIMTTAEKCDSLLRHRAPWLPHVRVVVLDEIHLLNDASRGPTLEILTTLLKAQLKRLQLIGLSATIGNPRELAEWLEADLVQDSWRPVVLRQGVYCDGEVEFVE